MGEKVQAFQNKYKTRKEREDALKKMSNKEINVLVKDADSPYGKNYYAQFLKKKVEENH